MRVAWPVRCALLLSDWIKQLCLSCGGTSIGRSLSRGNLWDFVLQGWQRVVSLLLYSPYANHSLRVCRAMTKQLSCLTPESL